MDEKIIGNNSFQKGMVTDDSIAFADDSSYYYALNAIVETKEGDRGSISNEIGNEICAPLKSGYKIIGSKLLNNNDEFVIFSTNDVSSEIGIFNAKLCTYTTTVNAACLNFNSCFPVFSLFNLKNGCDRIIYFTDNRNVYRSINLDDLSKYYDGVNFVCSRLNFSPTVKCPVLDVTEIKQSGGELLLGSYQFFIRYLDNDLNTTKWLTSTQPIIIIKDSLDIQYSEISGGKNLIDSTNQIGVFTPSSKAITIQLNNLDANFTYYQYAIVEKTSGNNTVSRVTLSNNIPITQSLYTYTGTNTTGTISIDDIIIDKLIVEKVKAHAQTDNRLFLSNLSDLKTYDWIKVQQAALTIKTSWISKKVPKQSKLQGDPKNGLTYENNKTYMRDEIYAMSIRGKFKNGNTTPCFHIPGRESITPNNPNYNTWVNLGNANNVHTTNTFTNYEVAGLRETLLTLSGNDWDKVLINSTTSRTTPSVLSTLTYQDNIKAVSTNTSEPRWKIFNTGIVTDVDVANGIYKGQLAYYESTELYPDVKDCDGNQLYGNLTSTPIRHHKIIDGNSFPHMTRDYNNGDILPIGLQFDISTFISTLTNTYPEILTDIDCWEIVQAERTEDNKTVIDKGITTFREASQFYYGYDEDKRSGMGPNDNESTNANNNPSILNTDTVRFYSPKILLKRNVNPSYYKIENASLFQNWMPMDWDYDYVQRPSLTDKVGFYRYALTNKEPYENISHLWCDYLDGIPKANDPNATNNRIIFPSNIKIDATTYIDATSKYEPYSFVQGSLSDLTSGQTKNYNYTPHTFQMKGLFRDLFSINGTNTSIDKPMITYGALKKNIQPYNELTSITYFDVPNTKTGNVIDVWGGDTFITPMVVELANRGAGWKGYPGEWSQNFPANNDSNYYNMHQFIFTYVESDINFGLRSKSTISPDSKDESKDYDDYSNGRYFSHLWVFQDTLNTTHPIAGNPNYNNIITPAMNKYFLTSKKTGALVSNELQLINQYIDYNYDYSNHGYVKPFYALPFNWDYCKDCQNKYPNRIVYSEKSFQELRKDAYKDIKVNNYVDLNGVMGEVNNLFLDKDKLYALTDKSLVFVPTKSQTIKTNDSLAYLGTGDITSIPQQAISTTEFGYSGTKDILTIQNTEFGTVYYNRENQTLFHLSSGLSELTMKGMRRFFKKHGRFNLNDDFVKIYKKDYPFNDKPLFNNASGTGFISGYDTENKRYLLTKIDYKLLPLAKTKIDDGLLLYNFVTKTWEYALDINTPATTPIEMRYFPELFKNVSWTISYDFTRDWWVSFHSYIPEYYFNNSDTFFTSKYTENAKGSTDIWKHNTGLYQTYYGTKYKHTLWFNIRENPFQVKTFESIRLFSKTWIPINNTFNRVEDKTFNSILAVNSKQSTGLHLINVLKPNNGFNMPSALNSNISWSQVENGYYLNNLRDYTTKSGNNDDPINLLLDDDYFFGEENLQNTNQNKSPFELERMRDYFLSVKLDAYHPENYKISTDLISTKNNISFR